MTRNSPSAPTETHEDADSAARRSAAAHALLLTARRLTQQDGCTPLCGGSIRLYRYSRPTEFVKTQILVPGIVVVLQGRKTARIDGREWVYEPHHHLVMLREAVCRATVVQAEHDAPYLAVAVDLPVESLLKAALAVRAAGGGPAGSHARRPAAMVAETDGDTFETVARLLATATATAGRAAALRPLILEELCIHLLSSCSAGPLLSALAEPREAGRILAVMQAMRQRLAEKLGLADWAREAAMSPAHFSRRFSAIAGMAPMRYLRRCRLEAALLLMVEQSLGAGDAGYRVGYESQAHFSRDFKTAYGTPPAQYAAALTRHRLSAANEHAQTKETHAQA